MDPNPGLNILAKLFRIHRISGTWVVRYVDK
jgi:hypothetical protein